MSEYSISGRSLVGRFFQHGGEMTECPEGSLVVETAMGGEVETLARLLGDQAAGRRENLDDLVSGDLQPLTRIDAIADRIDDARENLLLLQMRLHHRDVAAHAAGSDPGAMRIVNRHGRNNHAGPAAILAAQPDLDILVAVIDVERIAAVHVLHEIGRQARGEFARRETEATLRRNIGKSAFYIGFPAEIRRAFDQVPIKLTRRHQGVYDIALAGHVPGENENAVSGVRRLCANMSQGQFERALHTAGLETDADIAGSARRHPADEPGAQRIAVRTMQIIDQILRRAIGDDDLPVGVDEHRRAGISGGERAGQALREPSGITGIRLRRGKASLMTDGRGFWILHEFDFE